MAVTYGFYDSLNHDRLYNAQQMSAIFDGIINDGVFASVGNQFHTVAGTGMQVIVKSGRAWFDSTWTLNDAEYPLSIDTADVLLTRIDAVVLEVNSEVATRANAIKIVKGTPASTPVKPALTNTAAVHQHALAYVTVAKNITAITNSMIEIVVGKTQTPYVTAILQTTDITDLFKKWENDFQVWFETVRSTLEGDIALNLQNQIDALSRSILKDDTKTAMGLDTDAVGDDAFKHLLNKATWARPYTNIIIRHITSSGSFIFPSNTLFNVPATIICVGGGGAGGGGMNYASSGGGGSGYVTIKKIIPINNKKYNIIVGAGVKNFSSDPNTQGGSTIFNSTDTSDNQIIALGGYNGKTGWAGGGGKGEAGGGGGGAIYYGGSNYVVVGGPGGDGKNGGGGGGGGGGYYNDNQKGPGGAGGNSINGGGGGGGGHGWSVYSPVTEGGTSVNAGKGGKGGNGDNVNSTSGSIGIDFSGTFFNESICPFSAIVTPTGGSGRNLSSNTGGAGGGGGGGVGGKGGKGGMSANAVSGGGGGGGGGYAASAIDITGGTSGESTGGAGGAGWFGSKPISPYGSSGGGGGGFSPKNYGHGARGDSTETGDGVCIIIFYVEDMS